MTEKDSVHANIGAERMAEAQGQIDQQLAEGYAHLAMQRAQYLALLREVKLVRAAESDRSWELADVEQRLRDLAEQREGPGDPLMEREIAYLVGQRTKLEEQILAHLLLLDELVSRARAAEQGLTAAEQDWAAREASLIAERDRLDEGRATRDR